MITSKFAVWAISIAVIVATSLAALPALAANAPVPVAQ